MRALADAPRIHAFMRALGRETRSAGRVYFTGGATAVLSGGRASTIDVEHIQVESAIHGLQIDAQLVRRHLDPRALEPSPRDFKHP